MFLYFYNNRKKCCFLYF